MLKAYLEPGDPSTMQTWNYKAVQAPQVEASFTPSPNVSRVHDVSPTLANLEYNPFIFRVHTQYEAAKTNVYLCYSALALSVKH